MSEGIKLSEVCNIKGGSGFPEKYQGKKAGNYPFIKVSDMNLPENRQTITKANNYVDDNLVKSLGLTVFPKNTIVFAKVGAAVYLNKRRILSEDTIIDNNMMGVVPHHIDSFFLYYLLLNVDLSIFIQPGALPSVNQNIVGNLLIPNYRLERQVHIRNILGSIDRAIAHTEALIEKYQQIKAGLMHDLFTRGIGADGKLRPTREEAPELYQESAIGWIPREWELKPLEYGLSASPKNGYSPKEVENWQGVYVLGLSCLTKNGFSPAHLKNAPKTALRSSAKLEDGDFLISRSNTQELVGLCGIYRDIGHDTIYPDLMMKLRLNRNVVAEFLEQYLLSQATRQRISAIAVGTSGSMVKINATTLKSLKVVYPDPSEQKEIVNKLRPIMNHIRCLETQLNKLQKQKSGLMHDLLTGKVPVKVNPDEVDHISN